MRSKCEQSTHCGHHPSEGDGVAVNRIKTAEVLVLDFGFGVNKVELVVDYVVVDTSFGPAEKTINPIAKVKNALN